MTNELNCQTYFNDDIYMCTEFGLLNQFVAKGALLFIYFKLYISFRHIYVVLFCMSFIDN